MFKFNFFKNFKESYDEMLDDKEEERVEFTLEEKETIKKELISEAKGELKILGGFALCAVIVMGVFSIIVIIFKPKIDKGVDILLSKFGDVSQTEVSGGDNPTGGDNPQGGIGSVPTEDKVDCTKPYNATYKGDYNGTVEEVNILDDGGFNRIIGDNAGIGNYTISGNIIHVTTYDGGSITYTISNDCDSLSRVENGKKIVLKKE